MDSGLAWAVETAKSYAHDAGDPVGPWFEAALPGRDAFCMRDVAHMAMGAEALGLSKHVLNMVSKFAASISPELFWCSYWEIDKENRPAPVDFTSDSDFWFNLPAHFDLIDACWRIYRWTNNDAYVQDDVFLRYYEKAMVDFVGLWDVNEDGLPEGPGEPSYLGIPTYTEHGQSFEGTGFDVLTEMHAACLAYAEILTVRGEFEKAARWKRSASELRADYEHRWWNPKKRWFWSAVDSQGKPIEAEIDWPDRFLAGMVPSAKLLDSALAFDWNLEAGTYLSEILFRYGRNEEGYRQLVRQGDPNLERRGYPEVSYCMVGSTVNHLLGLQAQAPVHGVTTRSRIPGNQKVEAEGISVLGGQIGLVQHGRSRTTLANSTGRPLLWRAEFAGLHDTLKLGGSFMPTCPQREFDGNGQPVTWCEVVIDDGQELTVQTA